MDQNKLRILANQAKQAEKYQGREFQKKMQAPNEIAINKMISRTIREAKASGLEDIRVLERRRDPDGGWEATVSAHNFNPISWIAGKAGSLEKKVERTWGQAKEIPGKIRDLPGETVEHFRSGRESAEAERIAREQRRAEQRGREEGELGIPDAFSTSAGGPGGPSAAKAEIKARAQESARIRGKREKERLSGKRVKAESKAKEAEMRARQEAELLETELYGEPLSEKELTRQQWSKYGTKIGEPERVKTPQRLAEIRSLKMAAKAAAEGTELASLKSTEALESFKAAKRKKKVERVTKPISQISGGIVSGVTGATSGMGRSVGGFGLNLEPYRFQSAPQVTAGRRPEQSRDSLEHLRKVPTGPQGGMDLGHLRRVTGGVSTDRPNLEHLKQTPSAKKYDLFGGRPTVRKGRGKGRKSTYPRQMKDLRRQMR